MRRLLVLLAAGALWGCGGDAPPEAPRRTPAPAPVADARAAADALAMRCGLIRPVPGDVPAIVPEGLLPPGSFIARGRRTGSSARATILLPLGFHEAHRTLAAAAPKAGFKVIFSEQEPLEAEVYLSGEAGIVKFRIYGSAQCPDTASQALFERAYTEG